MAAPVKAPVKLERSNAKSETQRLAKRYQSEDKVEVSISPLYANELGNVHTIALHGISIYVPVDGRNYKIPYSYALELKGRIAAIDEKSKRMRKMANVAKNSERTAGELKLFR